jgi:lipoyl(octanoyl) transferase
MEGDIRALEVRRLGLVSYAEALALQQSLVADRQAGRIADTLLLLQHPHVLTLGVKTAGAREHIVATPEVLEHLGVEVFETGRGGDVTYHGPGQIVGYPILDLKPDRQDVHRYVRDLEELMIRVCADFQVPARREHGLTGVWVDPRLGPAEKIGAIGVRISKWVTSHGFAFNVNTDLEFFRLIVPCGLSERGVTSLARQIGRQADVDQVESRFVHHFARVFERDVHEGRHLSAGSAVL